MTTIPFTHVTQQFNLEFEVASVEELGGGIINKTLLVTTTDNSRFILQQINTAVFEKPAQVMHNMSTTLEHVHNTLTQIKQEDTNPNSLVNQWKMLEIIQTKHGHDFLEVSDEEGNDSVWRMITFVENTQVFDTIPNTQVGYEVGSALGFFHSLLSTLETAELADTLEGFHITPNYLKQYDLVKDGLDLQNVPEKIVEEVTFCTEFIEQRRAFASVLEDAKAKGELTLRVTHGDPKVNNILLHKDTARAVSIIDLDTVKPALVHYDIGDCIRSSCNPLGEDAGGNWKAVCFDIAMCKAVLEGYIAQAQQFLTKQDFTYIYDAIRLITFELGLRFFTDYVAGNVYFTVSYPEHNLHRALVQFRLAQSIEEHEEQIQSIIQEFIA